MDSKQTAFIALMASLGTVLSIISIHIGPTIIPTPGGTAALDLSHIATFVAAILGGPLVGAVVGLFDGIYAGYYFGYAMAGGLGLVSLIGLPLGKAMTGLISGYLYRKAKVITSARQPILATPLTLISYIPESIYTALYFLYLIVLFGFSPIIGTLMIPIVIPKGWIEIAAMSLLVGALARNTGFKQFAAKLFPSKPS